MSGKSQFNRDDSSNEMCPNNSNENELNYYENVNPKMVLSETIVKWKNIKIIGNLMENVIIEENVFMLKALLEKFDL